jgi:hypothetical protein
MNKDCGCPIQGPHLDGCSLYQMIRAEFGDEFAKDWMRKEEYESETKANPINCQCRTGQHKPRCPFNTPHR